MRRGAVSLGDDSPDFPELSISDISAQTVDTYPQIHSVLVSRSAVKQIKHYPRLVKHKWEHYYKAMDGHCAANPFSIVLGRPRTAMDDPGLDASATDAYLLDPQHAYEEPTDMVRTAKLTRNLPPSSVVSSSVETEYLYAFIH